VERYLREILTIGKTVFDEVRSTTALVVGCGALGSSIAEALARLGIGKLVVVDADVVEEANLSTAHMFGVEDLGRPKVDACKERLKSVNPDVEVVAYHDIIDPSNVEKYVGLADVVFDGLDSLYARLLLNDACVKLGKPLFYAGVSGEYITVKAVVPGATSCLSCFLNYEGDDRNACDVVGTTVLAPTVAASLQVQQFLNYLRGRVKDELILVELDDLRLTRVELSRNPKCRSCGLREFPYLRGEIRPGSCEIKRIAGRTEALQITTGTSYVKICYPEGCFERRRY